MGKKSKKKKNYKKVNRPKPAANKAVDEKVSKTSKKADSKTKSKEGFFKKFANAYAAEKEREEREKDPKDAPRRPFFALAGMHTVSIVFLILITIAACIMGHKEDVWAVLLFIGLGIVPCLTFWELSYSTKIFGYDLRTKPVPEGIYPIRRGFHVAALIFTNLCAFFVVPGIAVIWVELYFGPLIFGLLVFGLPAAYCWFKTFEYRLLKKSYLKHLKKTEEKKK
jgi:hypothetical protein